MTAPESLVHRATVFAHGNVAALLWQEARNQRPDLAVVFKGDGGAPIANAICNGV
jgi:hypothetical protein